MGDVTVVLLVVTVLLDAEVQETFGVTCEIVDVTLVVVQVVGD